MARARDGKENRSPLSGSLVDEAFPGAVTLIQRFDSALRLNVHAHTLVLDGVYVKRADGEGITFLRLPAPTDDEVHEVATRTAKRVIAALAKRGRTIEGLSSGNEGNDQAILACSRQSGAGAYR